MAADARVSPIPRMALALGLAGLLPLIAAASAMWMPTEWFPATRALTFGTLYGGLILSFLGGIRWGAALAPIGARRQALDFAGSVVPMLMALAALLLPPVLGLSALAAGFLLMALWDVMTVEQGRLPQWFGLLRMILTTGAVLSQLAMLVALFI